MTVQELIKELEKMPQELEVLLPGEGRPYIVENCKVLDEPLGLPPENLNPPYVQLL